MKHSALVLPVAVAGCWLAAGCSSMRWVEEEHHLRFDAQRSELVWLEIERGLIAADGADKGLAEIAALLAGVRRYPPGGGLVSIDFDEAVQEDQDEDEREVATRQILERIGARLTVAEVGLFEDQEGVVSLYRLTRVREPSVLLEAFNVLCDLELAEDDPTASAFVPSFPIFDSRTRDLFYAHAKAGGQWLRCSGSLLVFDVPMTSANAARCAADMIARAPESNFERGLWSHLSDLHIADERCTATLAPGADGAFHFTPSTSRADVEARERALQFAVSLRAGTLPIDAKIGIEGVRAKLAAK